VVATGIDQATVGRASTPATTTAAPTSEPEAKDGCGCSSVGARRAPAAATGWLVVSSVLSLGVMRRRRARRQ